MIIPIILALWEDLWSKLKFVKYIRSRVSFREQYIIDAIKGKIFKFNLKEDVRNSR